MGTYIISVQYLKQEISNIRHIINMIYKENSINDKVILYQSRPLGVRNGQDKIIFFLLLFGNF